MAKAPKNHGKDWTRQEVKALRQLVKENTPTRVIGLNWNGPYTLCTERLSVMAYR